MRRWGPAAVALVVLAATALAFATTEREKLEKTPFSVLEVDDVVSPVCGCEHARATIALRFRRTHVVSVRIEDSSGRVVRSLAHERTVHGGVVDLRWDGRKAGGEAAADGDYSLQFVLDAGRTFDPPYTIRVDTVAPRVTLVGYAPRVLRRRPGVRVRIRYRVDEAAHPLLYVDGRREIRGYATALSSRFDWFARGLRAGRHRLQLAAVDLAGNVGPRTRPFVVRIR